tara:strand:+ start:2072 stop:2290 length:219 start_codon:yes stop_codon:yes gene_type:complete
VYEYNDLTDDELIEDVIARAFAMMLGVHLPTEEALTLMQRWIKMEAVDQGVELNEDFILKQIPNFINYLYRR